MGKGWAPCGGRQSRVWGRHRSGEMPGPRPPRSICPALPPGLGSPPEVGNLRKRGWPFPGMRRRRAWWSGDCTRSPVVFRKTETYVSSSLEFGVCSFYPSKGGHQGPPERLCSTSWRGVAPSDGRPGLRRWEEPSEGYDDAGNPPLPPLCLTWIEVLSYFLGFAFKKKKKKSVWPQN